MTVRTSGMNENFNVYTDTGIKESKGLLSASDLIDFVPIVGDIKSFYETLDAASKGHYAQAGLLGLGAVAGLVPGVGDALNKVAKVLSKKLGKRVSVESAANVMKQQVAKGKIDPDIKRFADDIAGQIDSFKKAGRAKAQYSTPSGYNPQVNASAPGKGLLTSTKFKSNPNLPYDGYAPTKANIPGAGKISNIDEYAVSGHELLGHGTSPRGLGLIPGTSGEKKSVVPGKSYYGRGTLTAEGNAWRTGARRFASLDPSPKQIKEYIESFKKNFGSYINKKNPSSSTDGTPQDLDAFTKNLINKTLSDNVTLKDIMGL